MPEKTNAELCGFMRAHRLAVVATASPDGKPEAALVDIAVTDALEIIFETTSETRKIHNLRDNSRISFVIGWNNNETLQYDGVVDEPLGREQERITQHYLSVFPEKLSHRNWPGNFYFRARPQWIRFSNYYSPRVVEEHNFSVTPDIKPPRRRFSLAGLAGQLGFHAPPRR